MNPFLKTIHVILIFQLLVIGFLLPNPYQEKAPIPVTARLIEQGERYISDSVLFGPAPKIPEHAHPVAVSIPGHTFPIVQQPAGQPGFVSVDPTVVTQFGMPSEIGKTVGLLAHNFLAGTSFMNIERGEQIGLYFKDGIFRTYRVVQQLEYQALQPFSVYSDFINLAKPEIKMDSTQVFEQVYQQGDRLVLQTCIEKNGNTSWGRLFVIAIPVRTMASVSWEGSVG
jgi:hypothetical protein